MSENSSKDLEIFDGQDEGEMVTALVPQIGSLSVGAAVDDYKNLVLFVQKVMTTNIDYGIIPGTGKPCLYKPGAEKMRRFFNLGTETLLLDKTEDWHGSISLTEFPLFSYDYVTTIRDHNGRVIATCDGNCNSYESKYRWRWVNYLPPQWNAFIQDPNLIREDATETEFKFAVDKAETTGKYGKPQEYWDGWVADIQQGRAKAIKRTTGKGKEMDAWERDGSRFRIPSDDIFSQVNTLKKMAQKRSFVGAMLLATGASEFFTQDLDDYASHLSDEEVSIQTFVPDKDVAARKLMAYVRSKGHEEDPGGWIKKLLEANKMQFSLDNWMVVLDLIDKNI